MELHQKSLLEKRSFYLLADNIKIFTKKMDGSLESIVEYDDITRARRSKFEKNARLFLITLSFAAFSVVGAIYNIATGASIKHVGFWLLMTVVLGIYYQLTKRHYILLDLVDGRSIFFLKNKPSEDALERFISEIFSRKRNLMRQKYFHIDRTKEPEEEKEKLLWLLQEEHISKEEYETLLVELEPAQKTLN